MTSQNTVMAVLQNALQTATSKNGTLCDRIHYCSRGQCKNPDKQCMNIYGYPARSAPEDCYISMNTKGDWFGNCGRPTAAQQRYATCSDNNIFCGKLICTGVRYLLRIQAQHTVIQVPLTEMTGPGAWMLSIVLTSLMMKMCRVALLVPPTKSASITPARIIPYSSMTVNQRKCVMGEEFATI